MEIFLLIFGFSEKKKFVAVSYEFGKKKNIKNELCDSMDKSYSIIMKFK